MIFHLIILPCILLQGGNKEEQTGWGPAGIETLSAGQSLAFSNMYFVTLHWFLCFILGCLLRLTFWSSNIQSFASLDRAPTEVLCHPSLLTSNSAIVRSRWGALFHAFHLCENSMTVTPPLCFIFLKLPFFYSMCSLAQAASGLKMKKVKVKKDSIPTC